MLVTLDIKNTFQTLSWESIRKETIRRTLSAKIRRLANNYLTDRNVTINIVEHFALSAR